MIKAMLDGLKQDNPRTCLEVQMGTLRYMFAEYMEYYEDGMFCSMPKPPSYSDLNVRLSNVDEDRSSAILKKTCALSYRFSTYFGVGKSSILVHKGGALLNQFCNFVQEGIRFSFSQVPFSLCNFNFIRFEI